MKKFVIFTDSAADLPKSMVKDLDINYLGLICNIDKDEYRRTLTTNTIKTLKKLGVKIVAEGIETKEEFDLLRDLGVDYGQGYYIQKPTSIDELRLSYKDILS